VVAATAYLQTDSRDPQGWHVDKDSEVTYYHAIPCLMDLSHSLILLAPELLNIRSGRELGCRPWSSGLKGKCHIAAYIDFQTTMHQVPNLGCVSGCPLSLRVLPCILAQPCRRKAVLPCKHRHKHCLLLLQFTAEQAASTELYAAAGLFPQAEGGWPAYAAAVAR
jgi:hypothetical protein